MQRCADRIATELKEREQSFAEVLRSEDDESLSEEPLAITPWQVIKIELSWGGPADWLEVWHQGEDIDRVVYHFADWFDHAEEEVGEESPLWKAAEYYLSGLEV